MSKGSPERDSKRLGKHVGLILYIALLPHMTNTADELMIGKLHECE